MCEKVLTIRYPSRLFQIHIHFKVQEDVLGIQKDVKFYIELFPARTTKHKEAENFNANLVGLDTEIVA